MSIVSTICETISAAVASVVILVSTPFHAHASYVPQGTAPGQMLVVGQDGKLPSSDASNLFNIPGSQITGALPPTLIDGYPKVYDSNGVIQAVYNPRFFVTQATSDTSGNFSVDISSVGYTVAPNVQLTAVSTGTGNQSAFFPIVTGVTTSTITGRVLTPALAAIGVLSVTTASSAVKVNVLATGR